MHSKLGLKLAYPLLISAQQMPFALLDYIVALQVVKMSIEHAGAPLTLEPKNDYMKRKIEERSLAPNSTLNGAEQVCALLLLLHARLGVSTPWDGHVFQADCAKTYTASICWG